MSTVPYTFANSVGNIPLAYLDANFSNVKAAATTAGTVTTAAQPNITSVGTLSSLTVTGNITATNFTGNISGNISNAVYAETAGISGTVTTAAQPNITSVGTLTVLTSSGNIRTTGGAFVGSAAGLTSIPGANVTGTVANATYATSADSATTATSATTAGTVTTAAQPNITSVGTLSSLTVTGNITSSANISGTYILGNGSQLTDLPASYNNSNVTTLLSAFGSNTISTSGNVSAGNVILGTGSKILGDFTTTVANGRTVFQTTSTTTNGYTGITAIPGDNNTGGISSGISLYASSNVGNSSWSSILQANTEARLISSKNGLGSYLPITIYTSELERVKFDINGNVGIGNSTPLDALAVTGNAYVSGNVTASGTLVIPTVVTNTITSDDSSYVTVEDGLNVVGDVDATNILATTIRTLPVIVAELPSAVSIGAGSRAFVTDADSVTFGNLVVGGAGNSMPVWSNGTNWYIG